MKINKRIIGPKAPPLIIAEIGINHGGDLEVAKQMVLAAAKAGCEAVKHQTHIVDDEMTEEAKSIFPPNAKESIWEVIRKCALSLEDEESLKGYAESLGLIYLSTPFSRAAANFLNEIQVPAFKIGSGECNHLPLLKHVASLGKPIIMSTGMQSIDKLTASVDILDRSGINYALLQCTNLYPSPPEAVSLSGMSDLKEAFPRAIVGFSDHSIGPSMALAAVALGARVVERHFTDSRYRSGPDIACSMDPVELKYLIERSREIHYALQNRKARTTAEEAVYKFARASVVADRNLPAGAVISETDIWARRPGNGDISVEHFYDVIGKTLRVKVDRNQQLKWSDFSGE